MPDEVVQPDPSVTPAAVSTPDAGSPTPQTASPDLGAATTIPDQQTQPMQVNGNPAQAQAQNADSGGTFEKILQVLAGSPQKNAHYDPDIGKMISTPVTSKGSLAAHIVTGALMGMFRGMAAPPGPGHVAEAGNLALQGSIQDQQRQQGLMQADYERQQQAQVQKYQIAHLNAQTALDTANAASAGMDTLQRSKAMNEDAIQQLAASGAVETDGSGNPVTMTQSDILAKVKSGELNAGDSIGMSYGGTLIDGKPQALYVVNKDPNAPVKISQDQYDRWTAQGVNVPKEVVGQSIPAKSFSAYTNQALVHSTSDAALATLKHDAGTNKTLLAKLPASVDPTTPGMATALRTLQQALRGTKGDVYSALEATYQKNPQSGQILLNAFGGKDLITDISNQHASDVKAAQAAESAEAEEKVRAPYIKQEHEFQASLVRETAALNKQTANENARDLKADEMVTTEANNRDSDLRNINDLMTNLAQLNEGNQSAMNAFKTKFAEHEIVEGGVKRMNEVEYKNLSGSLGSYGRQFESWVDSGFKGDMPKATKQEMVTILNAEAQSRNGLYNSRVGNINTIIRGGQPAQGGGAAPARPAGVPANAVWNGQANGGRGMWVPVQQ